MDQESKKRITAEYKERKVIGGICAVKNTANGKLLLLTAPELQTMRNRFEFTQKINSCFNPKLQKDWTLYGKESFSFEVLEELKKKEDQTSREFAEDLKVLEEMWREKFEAGQLY